MLTTLSIKNYVLIEDINIDFISGLTVITGETGAGKSILMGALDLLTGSRADQSLVRLGASACVISAVFDISKLNDIQKALNALSIDCDDNTLNVRRVIDTSGKSKAFINDTPVNISTLAAIGKHLIDFHGQDEKHFLFDNDYQLQVVDGLCKNSADLEKLSQIYGEYKTIENKIKALEMSDAERAKKIDLYDFQLTEISEAALTLGEDVLLEESLPSLKNAEKIALVADQIANALYRGENTVMQNLSKIIKNTDELISLGAKAETALESANNAYYQAEEAYAQVNDILKNTNADPEALDNAQIRLELIKKLKRKYGATIEEILNYKTQLETELKNLNDYDANTQELNEELAKLHKQMGTLCLKISAARKSAAAKLSKKVVAELADLEMPKAEFDIEFTRKEITENGFDYIEFMFNANVGQKMSPLKNTASGGELSRVLLGLVSAIGAGEHHTIIFDEIDTGTGGKAGQKIGEKLFNIAVNRQTFAITHIPQVAVFADTHVKIYKAALGGKTITKTETLSSEEHIKEIARMISGEHITDSALKHAKELIRNLKKI